MQFGIAVSSKFFKCLATFHLNDPGFTFFFLVYFPKIRLFYSGQLQMIYFYRVHFEEIY